MLPEDTSRGLKKSDSPAAARATLAIHPPPADLAAQIFGFVHRDDDAAGHVVRVLPEMRASIQIMTADPYWLRGARSDAPWERLPRVSLWAPKYDWCYGFAAGHIKAYATGLTVAGLYAITQRPASQLVNQVIALSDIDAALAHDIDVQAEEPFDVWRIRAAARLRDVFSAAPAIEDPVAASLDILATEESSAVARAAEAVGLSERQYRRLFIRFYGVSPKHYQRAIRVDRMIRRLHEFPWETDAYGEAPIQFSDQPHAIREFRAMTGLTPRAYLHAKQNRDATLRSVPVEGIAAPR